MKVTFAAILAIAALTAGVANAARSDNLERRSYEVEDLQARQQRRGQLSRSNSKKVCRGGSCRTRVCNFGICRWAPEPAKRGLDEEEDTTFFDARDFGIERRSYEVEDLQARQLPSQTPRRKRQRVCEGFFCKTVLVPAKRGLEEEEDTTFFDARDFDIDENLEMRDFSDDDLEARGFGKKLRGILGHIFRRSLMDGEDDDLIRRSLSDDIDDLEARGFGKKLRGILGHIFRRSLMDFEDDDVVRRSLSDDDEDLDLMMRDLLGDDDVAFTARDLQALLQGRDDFTN